MQAVGIVRVDFENLTIDQLSLGQPARLMPPESVSNRPREDLRRSVVQRPTLFDGRELGASILIGAWLAAPCM
jgi:hypothetical protein